MTRAYTHLAEFYDRLMDVDYCRWEEYLLSLIKNHGGAPKTILDLGCGTGNLTIPLARRGYALVGVDLSAEMVTIAKTKAQSAGFHISFSIQDMRELELPGKTFDLIFSACDAVNYLLTKDDLQRTLRGVFRHLAPGGLFMFDLNSAYKLQEVYGDQFYADLEEDFGYFWENSFDPELGICNMDLTFFVKAKNGLYRRVTEKHQQKVWLPGQIKNIAQEAGFLFLACYDFFTLEPCSPDCERWQLVLTRAD